MKGFNFADWNVFCKPRPPNVGPLYNPLYADQRLKELAATGTNWIALTVNIFQDTIASTEVRRDQYGTPTDAALRHMIDLAHSLGMRVSLYPGILLSQDPTHYWTQIGTAFTTEEQWQTWFTSYRQIIVQYATLAQDAGVDMFFIGQELSSTTHKEDDWRRIAQEVRQVYKGPIIYEALNSHGAGWAETPFGSPPFGEEQRITWWDALDYIGVMAYYPLTDKNNPTVEELKSAWVERGWLALLENLSNKYQKPIIFSEIGYESKDGANKQPLSDQIDLPLDLQEQVDCYQAVLEVFLSKPWMKGIFWWQWFANPLWPPIGPSDKRYTPQGKPAEEVLKKFYLAK